MADNLVDPSKSNETGQLAVDEWKNDVNETSNNASSNNDNNAQNLVETLNHVTVNDNTAIENQESINCNFTINESVESPLADRIEPKNHQGNKEKSGNRKGRGGYHKSYNNNNSFDSNSNNFQNNGLARGRGRGRSFIKQLYEENESFGDGFNSNHNNHGDNTTPGHRGRGRGRGQNRGRGGRFKEKSNDGWYGNNEDGHKKKENDKSTGPKAEYIPPDIESEESIAGIEAGLHFDKYNTIEVKVSGDDPPKRLTSFNSSGLRDILLKNLSTCNFCTPTPIQNYAIPIVIAGRDLMASAQTGSGKTVSSFIL